MYFSITLPPLIICNHKVMQPLRNKNDHLITTYVRNLLCTTMGSQSRYLYHHSLLRKVVQNQLTSPEKTPWYPMRYMVQGRCPFWTMSILASSLPRSETFFWAWFWHECVCKGAILALHPGFSVGVTAKGLGSNLTIRVSSDARLQWLAWIQVALLAILLMMWSTGFGMVPKLVSSRHVSDSNPCIVTLPVMVVKTIYQCTDRLRYSHTHTLYILGLGKNIDSSMHCNSRFRFSFK